MGEDDFPRRGSSPWRTIIWVVVGVFAVVVALRIAGLLVVLWPVDMSRAQRIEDQNNLRQIANLVIVAKKPLPVAQDGRIDVYAILIEAKVPQRDIVAICRSSRAGKGPSWEEIQAGDYRNFPYQRYRGAPDPKVFVRVPLVWDREAAKDGRVAAFTDGSALFTAEAEFQEFFRGNPGQE
jgi:hypothetical protein